MAVVNLGTALSLGGQITIAGYIVSEDQPGGADIDMEDVDDATGERASRVIYKVDDKRQLTLIATTGDFSEFPEGAMCTAAGLTDFFVDSAPVTKTRGAKRGVISLTKINI